MLLLFVIGKYYIRALLSWDILKGIQNLLQVSVRERVLVEFNSLQVVVTRLLREGHRGRDRNEREEDKEFVYYFIV